MLGIMATPITNRHRGLFRVLFFIFEALWLVSNAILLTVRPHPWFWDDSEASRTLAAITFMFSFVGLFVVCFLLRQTDPRLANIGWVTLLGVVLISLFMPWL
jgi:hypothetical protein